MASIFVAISHVSICYWLEDDNTIKVRGHGGVMNLFYRTQTWKRLGTSRDASPARRWNTIDDTANKVKSEVEIIERNGELFGYIRKIFLLPHEGKDPICIACEGKLKNAKIVSSLIVQLRMNCGKELKVTDITNLSTTR